MKCDFSGIENFADDSFRWTVEVNGSRIWYTQEDEMTICAYRLNDRLQLEEMEIVQ